MINRELSRQLQILNDLFIKSQSYSCDDIEFMSHWAKYLCILCVGFLENSLTIIYSDYCENNSHKHVSSYAQNALSRIQNPKTSKFIEVTGEFNKDWGKYLEDFIDQEGRKEAINTIIGNRHLIAHGKNSDITVHRLREYFDKSIDVVNFMENQCK